LLESGDVGGFPRPLTSGEEFYRAIHPSHIEGGKISFFAFLNPTKPIKTNRMSVDWAEKSTPQQTLDRWARWGDGRGVASLTAELCWNNGQAIEYTPTQENPSHSDVVGNKNNSYRVSKNLAKGAKLVIPATTSSNTRE
jgi:hypothetical protein